MEKSASPFHPFDDTVRVSIHQCKDLRDTECLIGYMQGENLEFAAEAALALASVGDTLALAPLEALFGRAMNLDDTALAHRVQRNTALALFHCGGHLLPSVADRFMDRTGNAEVRRLLLRAIGHCAPKPYASSWQNRLDTATPKERLGLVQLAYELCARAYTDSGLVAFAIGQLGEYNPIGLRRQSAAYLARLQRIKDYAFPLPPLALITAFEAQHDAVAKMFLALSLSMLPPDQTENTILQTLESPQDYRVHCHSINALGTGIGWKLRRSLSGKIGLDNPHVELAAANCVLRNRQDYLQGSLDSLLKRAVGWRARSSLLQALAMDGGDRKAQVAAALDGAAHGYERSEIYAWMGQLDIGYLDMLLERFASEDDDNAKSNALLAIAAIVEAQGYGKEVSVRRHMVALLGKELLSDNAYRVYVSANGLLKTCFETADIQWIDLNFDSLAGTWALPRYYETRWELEKLALKAQGLAFEAHVTTNPYNNPIDWDWVKELPARPLVRMETTKGVIDMEFDLAAAPGSVAYIMGLIENGFYTGLAFHRVVGCFVVQGGDPTGSGSGGPEGSLRSEHSHHTYREGAVGLASSGKDTEGCQFFITHNHTPHLNGRYTILGYVSGGMDVVHRIEVGDHILRMEWIRGN